MIILLPLLRRLSIRNRLILGSVLSAIGLTLVVLTAAGMPGLLIDGIVAAVIGAIFLAHGWSAARRAPLAG